MAIALEPGGRRERAQPVRHNGSQIIESGAQRLANQFEKMQIAHGAQHVRAVGALLTARFNQATRLETLEHRVQQPVLRLPGDEARAELGQHAEVEPRVGELKPECILPIDPGTHGIGRLPVAEMLEELEDRDQGQSPRSQGRLALAGVKRSEILILVKRTELVTQPHDDGALGEGGSGNARRLGRDLADWVRMETHGSILPVGTRLGNSPTVSALCEEAA